MYNAIEELQRLTLRDRQRPPVLSLGSADWWVRLLRRLLATHGVLQKNYADPEQTPEVPEEYDATVESCVKVFQRRNNLTDDGICGPVTWATLAVDPADDPNHIKGTGNPAVRETIVDLAINVEQRNIREHGRNRGPTVSLILLHAAGRDGWAWCVAFCWALVDLSHLVLGLEPPRMDKLSCSRLVKWAKKHGRMVDPADVEPGDLLILKGGNTGHKHVGIITGEPDDEGRFPTVEGNTNDAGSAEGDGVYAKLRDPAEEPCVFVRVS